MGIRLDFKSTVSLTWLNRDGGIAVATADYYGQSDNNAPTYRLTMLVGPDGCHVLESRCIDAAFIYAEGLHLGARHDLGYERLVEAIRTQWAAERDA